MTSWPAVDFERLTWRPTGASWAPAIADYLDADRPYLASVPPHIAGRTVTLPAKVAVFADEAARELSRLDAELGTRVASFAPVLLRSEAASSSQIEHLTASARAIFTAELGGRASRNAREIAANTATLTAAISLANEITPEAILEMHSVLMSEQPQHTPGNFRREAVWIGARNDSPIGADFVPPYWERVPTLITDLAKFVGRHDTNALVSTAIAHAQFETIHPFTDGNGRTGRALAQAMLRYRGVTRAVAVPVSAGLLADISAYHHALTAYRQGDLVPIVEQFAMASLRAIANTRELVTEIDQIVGAWRETVSARADSGIWQILDLATQRPVFDAQLAADKLKITVNNVYPLLTRLTEAGVLKATREHRSGTLWRSDEILGAIDKFAARAGRRE